jgi:hypothetical protein
VISDWEAVCPVVGILTSVVFEPLRIRGRIGVFGFVPLSKGAAFVGQLPRNALRLVVDVKHQLARDLVGHLRTVSGPELDVQLRQPHDSQADLSQLANLLLDLVDREVRHRDNVFQKACSEVDPVVELLPVHRLL